jgi:hypothetical protein
MISALINVPKSSADWTLWSFNHALIHQQIRTALANLGVATGDYVLDPINPKDVQEWLLRVQQAHSEMNAALGLQSNDLTGVDFSNQAQTAAWIYLNWQEDNAAAAALQI